VVLPNNIDGACQLLWDTDDTLTVQGTAKLAGGKGFAWKRTVELLDKKKDCPPVVIRGHYPANETVGEDREPTTLQLLLIANFGLYGLWAKASGEVLGWTKEESAASVPANALLAPPAHSTLKEERRLLPAFIETIFDEFAQCYRQRVSPGLCL
jgi:hypothetical protein